MALVFSLVLAVLGLGVGVIEAQSTKVSRVGVLTVGYPEQLRQSLRELGYVEGRNLLFDVRETEGRRDLVDQLANDLARVKADVIVATYPGAVFSAKRATSTIPIVMVNTPDPVELGLVGSLARPGGTITGVTSLSIDVSIKQLELLKDAVPRASRIAVMWNPDNPWHPVTVKSLRAQERALGLQLQFVAVKGPDDFDMAYQRFHQAQALLILADPMTFAHRVRLAQLAAKHRLPTLGGLREYAVAGHLMSYWADRDELFRRAASYVDRILKGAKPGDLPIEQPTRYELVINLRTAKALALTLPPSLLVRGTTIE